MAVYFQFKSSTVRESIPIDGHFITVGNLNGNLKEKIIESKQLRRGDFDLIATNSLTKEDYLDDSTLIPRHSSVLVRRVPAQTLMPIVTLPVSKQEELSIESNSDMQTVMSASYPEDLEWDDFENDLYSIPDTLPIQSGNAVKAVPSSSIDDEDSKIRALIETPALDWQRQPSDGFGPGRGMMGGRGGFGRGELDRKTPPPGYVCHRCNVPGHFIQHCPTNGDPSYDIKRVKPPTGIPRYMLMATPDGSYALPSGAVAVLKPNEAAFEKEIEGIPTTRSVADFPPELHCPLCKQVMRDVVLTSKCCFTSFCDKCIREHIISKHVCVCGATNVLADDLLPNKTLRDTINRLLESDNSSGDTGGCASQVQDMESRIPQPKASSPAHSMASKAEQLPPPTQKEETQKAGNEVIEESQPVTATQQKQDNMRLPKVAEVSEVTHESISVKEAASLVSASLVDDEVQQKPISGESSKIAKNKKPRIPMPGGVATAEMQWRNAQCLAAENYMMSMGPAAYNPYWTGMQPGMDAFMPPYGGPIPYMGFGPCPAPMEVPFWGFLPPHAFGGQGMPHFGPLQRNPSDFGMEFNVGPPLMSQNEFEGRKVNVKRNHDIERPGESRELPRDREYSREKRSSGDISVLEVKSKVASSSDHSHRHQSDRQSCDPEPRSSSKTKYEHEDGHHRSHHRDRDHRDEYPRLDANRRYRDEKKDERHDKETDHYHQSPSDDRHHRDHSRPHQSSRRDRHRSGSATKGAPEAAAPSLPTADKKKASVFSRTSLAPEDHQEAVSKKRKLSSKSERPTRASGTDKASSNCHYEPKTNSSGSTRKSAASVSIDYESSDDDRHFKRRRSSRYELSPAINSKEELCHSKGSRERESQKEYGSYSKYR